MTKRTFKEELINYWSERSPSYGLQHQEELLGEQKKLWQEVIVDSFQTKEQSVQTILDIGTGPGFLAILLAELGYQVTAIDMTEDMLAQAQKNAGKLAAAIDWRKMNAEHLLFEAEQFDVIVTRNVTWNLENPALAYQEWHRVLKPGGILLNFDSNWYNYLYDESVRKEYEESRKQTQEMSVHDYYVGTDIAWMEELAREMPLSKIVRPEWDQEQLRQLGFQSVGIHENMNDQLLSETQKVNFQFSPIFMLKAIK